MDKELFYLDRVSFKYQDFQPVFKNLNILIQKGESVSLLGANGSGKSTLLKILCALVFPSEGVFRAFGQVINEEVMEDEAFSKEYHRRLGFIFQNSDVQLFTTRVWDEIAFGPLQLGWERRECGKWWLMLSTCWELNTFKSVLLIALVEGKRKR